MSDTNCTFAMASQWKTRVEIPSPPSPGPQYWGVQAIQPYVRTNKTDYIDAEAIAEAVGLPRMRIVNHRESWRHGPMQSMDYVNDPSGMKSLSIEAHFLCFER
jgi:hypothetical protein